MGLLIPITAGDRRALIKVQAHCSGVNFAGLFRERLSAAERSLFRVYTGYSLRLRIYTVIISLKR